MMPFLLAAILFSFFGLQRRKWQQGSNDCHERQSRRRRRKGRHGLPGDTCRAHGHGLHLPLGVFVFVLLFPFYWMAITAVKPDKRAARHATTTRSGWSRRRWSTFEAAVRHRLSELAVEHGDGVGGGSTLPVAGRLGAGGLCHRAAALQGLASRSGWRSSWPIWCRRRSCSSRWPTVVFKLGLFDTPLALILTYPTFLIPFCTWLLMGYFRSIPFELEECALIDGASRWQILTKIVLPLAVPGLISPASSAFTLSWNEFIYALTFISRPRTRPCRWA
jgi:multiple sugar transport system permease protein